MLRKPVEAALFDMDGLLLDTEVLYIEAMQQAARSLGREMALDFCHSMVGVPEQECSLMIEAYYGDGFSIEEFRGRFYGLLRGLLDAGIPLKPGVVELLDFLADRGLPLAVATSSERRTAERHLAKAGLLDRFTALATRNDVERPKPHPDIYLEAARRLGVAAERCMLSRIPTSVCRQHTPPAPWPSWCPTCCSPCPRREPGASTSCPTCTPR